MRGEREVSLLISIKRRKIQELRKSKDFITRDVSVHRSWAEFTMKLMNFALIMSQVISRSSNNVMQMTSLGASPTEAASWKLAAIFHILL